MKFILNSVEHISQRIILLLLLCISMSNAQFTEDLILQLQTGTQSEMMSMSSPQVGNTVYNTDDNKTYVYNGTVWTTIANQTATIVSTDAANKVTVGSDGGAYLGPTVYNGFLTISSAGSVVVSGMPFQPSQVTFVAHANVGSTNIDADNGTGNNDRGIDNSYGTMNGFIRDDSGTITQQVIYVGGHGNSINDISRYASSSNCIGVRYGDQNGDDLGKITAAFSSFTTDGFTLNATYSNGTITVNNGNPLVDVQPTDILNKSLVVLFTAYK